MSKENNVYVDNVIYLENQKKNGILPKNRFVAILDKLQEASDLVDRINDLIRESRSKVDCESCNGAALQVSHESIVVELLAHIMRDQDGQIEYFIYETDFGRGTVSEYDSRDKERIRYLTAGELYETLAGRISEEKEIEK